MLLSVVSLVLRFLRSVGAERQQIKRIACVVVLLICYALVDLFSQDALAHVVPILDAVLIGSFYAAIVIAILRYSLYDIDVLINRTLVYGTVTISLALVHFGGVVGLQHVFRALTGQGSQLAVVASTLAIAALFVPLRRRIQGFIDRRFYRGSTTRGRRWPASVVGYGMKPTWTGWVEVWWGWSGRRCNPHTRACGCASPARSRGARADERARFPEIFFRIGLRNAFRNVWEMPAT